MAIIQGGIIIEEGVPRPVNPFARVRVVPSGSTIQAAVDAAAAGDIIYIEPGEYDEQVTIARAKSKLTLVGVGGRGSVFIAPSASNPTAMTIEADDVTLINVGCEGSGTGKGLLNRGRRTRLYGCKIEGGAMALQLTLGTDAQIGAGTHGKGDDVWVVECEFAHSDEGVRLTATDYGAVTQVRIVRCLFHDLAKAFEESGGSASIRYRSLQIYDCVFDDLEDGSAPTAFILLNDDNANTGIVTRCSFPSAINSGKNLVSTALHWVSNYHTGGVSTGQPS